MALNNPYALSFDGVDDYTQTELTDSFINDPSITGQLTVEFWAKIVGGYYIFSSGANQSGVRGVVISYHGSNPLAQIKNGAKLWFTSITIILNEWHHYALVWDGTTLFWIVDGAIKQQSLASAQSNTYTLNYFRIGRPTGPYAYYGNFTIDEFRIWDHARTTEQIQQNMYKKLLGNETGLYVYYRFDEGSGTGLIDSTSNAWNGTIYGATWVPGEVDLTESELPGEVLLSAYLAGGASMSANTIRGRGLSASLSAGSTLSSTLIRTRGLSVNLTAGAELSAKMNLIASLTSHLAGGATLHAGLLRLFIYEGIYEITKDDYFTKSQPAKSDELANVIKVYTNPLQPAAVAEEVYKSNDPISIDPGTSKTTTIFYSEKPVIEAVASLTEAGPNLSITNATYYAWGANITISNAGTAAETCKIVVNGRPLRVQGRQLITKQDDVSIQENGRIEFEFPDNPLVQTPEMAEKIATKLLAFAIPRRDVELDWRGNPALTLADVVQIPEYQKGLVDKRGLFYITRQQFEFDGGLRVTTEGRKIE